MEKIGYFFLLLFLIGYLCLLVFGLIAAWPFGIIGFFLLLGLGFLFIKAMKDKIGNEEDAHYKKNVDI